MLCKKYNLLSKVYFDKRSVYCRCYCDVLPSSEVRIIRSAKVNKEHNLKQNTQPCDENINSKEFRLNEVNIQMLSRNLYEQLFKNPTIQVDPEVIKTCQSNLLRLGIDYRKFNQLPDVKLQLPELEGKDLVEHFYNIGEKQSGPYRRLLKDLAQCSIPAVPQEWSKAEGWTRYAGGQTCSVPCPPDDALVLDVEVLMSAGQRPTLACAVSPHAWYSWVSRPVAHNEAHRKYDSINYEDLIPLETDGDKLVGDPARCRIVVGHNVAYDRAKIKEQYWLDKTGIRFMDTMSMHTCVSGVSSYQRTVLKAKNKQHDPSDEDWRDISSLNNLSEVHKLYCGTVVDKETRDVFVTGTLDDVHENFQVLMQYCANDVIATHEVLAALLPMFLERFPHPVTLAGMLELGSTYLPVNSNWFQYIDSAETVFEDLKLESRQLLSRKADEACQLMHDDAYKKDLWMWDQDWTTQKLKLKKDNKKKKKEEARADLMTPTSKIEDTEKNGSSKEFENLSEGYVNSVDKNVIYADLHLEENLISKEKDRYLCEKFGYLYEMGELLPLKRAHLAGYPAWYRKLCTKPGKDSDWTPGANNITTSMQITPKLLRLSWEGYPLHYVQSEGWGFLVPFSRDPPTGDEPLVPLHQLLRACPMKHCSDPVQTDSYVLPKTVEEDLGRRAYYARKHRDEQAAANQYHGLGVWCGVQIQGCCHFLRLPHKDGPKYKVGNPLAKDFLDMFSQNVLTAQGNEAEKVLAFGRMMTYWRNNRERVMGQQAVELPDGALPGRLRGGRKYFAILPQVVVAGTLTRRASEPTWMTASNAQSERVGSELRAMVHAPQGYKFVGADVDSQELWIAALLGDSASGMCGGTAFGWSVLAGERRTETDLHSLTARAAAITRQHAKIINYARIYGAGQSFAERLLKQFNPTMKISEAKSKAAKMFATTKGKRVYVLKKEYMEGFMDEDLDEQVVEMSGYQAARLARLSGKRVEEMFERPRWRGGTESDMFNKLEQIAESEAPATAFLCGRLSRALEHAGARGGGTRLNWAVQSAAADFLHLVLVNMAHYAPKARFCLSFHDEVRYLVPDEYKYLTAMALQITNLYTRAFCSQRVGINDLPLSVAFFTSVEVDQVLRKESNLSCVTPSNPHGLEKGYGIPNGESLNIFDVIEKCKGIKTAVN